MSAKRPKRRPLTPRQLEFVRQYLLTGNASKAAREAGYSEKTAASIGEENLRKPEIQAEIQAGYARRQESYDVSEARLIKELARIAFFDLAKVMKADSSGAVMKKWEELDSDITAALSSVSETVTEYGGSTTVKAHDKLGAIKLLGQHIGMWKDGKPSGTDSDTRKAIHGRVLSLLRKHPRERGGGGGA